MFLHRRDGSTKLLFQICGNETKKKKKHLLCLLSVLSTSEQGRRGRERAARCSSESSFSVLGADILGLGPSVATGDAHAERPCSTQQGQLRGGPGPLWLPQFPDLGN